MTLVVSLFISLFGSTRKALKAWIESWSFLKIHAYKVKRRITVKVTSIPRFCRLTPPSKLKLPGHNLYIMLFRSLPLAVSVSIKGEGVLSVSVSICVVVTTTAPDPVLGSNVELIKIFPLPLALLLVQWPLLLLIWSWSAVTIGAAAPPPDTEDDSDDIDADRLPAEWPFERRSRCGWW